MLTNRSLVRWLIAGIFCFIFIFLPQLVHAQASIQGTVFADYNDNGQRDTGEHGLANIPITVAFRESLLNTVSTNDGRYAYLALEGGAHRVWIQPPNGCRVTTQINRAIFLEPDQRVQGADFGIFCDPPDLYPPTPLPPPPPTATLDPSITPPTPTPLPATYIVQSGDTLTSIAFLLGLRGSELAEYNDLTDANALFVGQILQVPRTVTPTMVPTATKVPASSTPTNTPVPPTSTPDPTATITMNPITPSFTPSATDTPSPTPKITRQSFAPTPTPMPATAQPSRPSWLWLAGSFVSGLLVAFLVMLVVRLFRDST